MFPLTYYAGSDISGGDIPSMLVGIVIAFVLAAIIVKLEPKK